MDNVLGRVLEVYDVNIEEAKNGMVGRRRIHDPQDGPPPAAK